MLGKVFRKTLLNMNQIRMKVPIVTARPFLKLDDEKLLNPKYIRQQIRNKPQGHNYKEMRGLFHNKVVRSNKYSTFSEKKTIYKQSPNVQKKIFYSEILDKYIKVNVTTTTLKKIKFYGSFDNYILICPSKYLMSFFGEYLRELMLRKINNPNLDIKNCKAFGIVKDVFKSKRKKKYDEPYFKKEFRHQDKTLDTIRGFEDLTRKELKINPERADYYSKNDPIFIEMAKRHQQNEEFLPQLKEKRNQILAKHPNQEIIKVWKRSIRQYQQEFLENCPEGNVEIEDEFE